MAIKQLSASDAGLPSFAGRFDAGTDDVETAHVFDLHSHRRAREAIEVGLSLKSDGYNVFVLGDDRTGRMDATRRYLLHHVGDQPPCCDWVYLNNFKRPNKPKPYRLARGVGRALRDKMEELVPALRDALVRAFGSDGYQEELRRLSERRKEELEGQFAQLRQSAQEKGLDVWMTAQGMQIVALDPDGEPMKPEQLMALPAEQQSAIDDAVSGLTPQMLALRKQFRDAEAERLKAMRETNKRVAEEAVGGLLDELEMEFGLQGKLGQWLQELRADIVEHIHLFRPPAEGEEAVGDELERRYTVNLITDNSDNEHPLVVVEPNPTYENLFGRIEYRAVTGTLQTDYTMIRPGSLHRANGGILIIRAEALAAQPHAWRFLKDALRDSEIRIEELYRMGSVPMAGTPQPRPIPLDVTVFLVGAPLWYYRFFALDPEFSVFFKVKADIDGDMPATDEDLAIFARLIQRAALNKAGKPCSAAALDRILGQASRWAGDRRKLTSRFELIEDLVVEANQIVMKADRETIELADVVGALADRRKRNNRIEDRAQERIRDKALIIATDGEVVGQVNGLVYSDLGDHAYGMPARLTAQTSPGPGGVVNIERLVAMGGPIQQKSVMIVEGFLAGRFSADTPMSFEATVTFEQSYGGIEGDSASLAELLVILSSLAEVPLRQDVGITGSMNQRGEVQAIGGANQKIEGFYRTCLDRGLTGKQGCAVPVANEVNLTLHEGITKEIATGNFHLWSVAHVDDVIELLTGLKADAVYAKAKAKLEAFDKALTERAMFRR
ncbi:MAG: AAA family ATPase [Alphaproteobacteria bacterium]